MTKNAKKINEKTYAIHQGGSVFTVSTATDSMITDLLFSDYVSWEADPSLVQGKKIVPYGTHNNLPVSIRQIMDQNNLAPGILEREIGLLHGQGPELYKKIYEDGDVRREYVNDNEVWAWLKDWDYRRFIDMATVEYKYLKGYFSRVRLAKSGRIGKPLISSLDVVPATDARLGWVETRRLEDVSQIFVGDFENNCLRGISTYPVWDPWDPFRHRVAMRYNNSYAYARNFYPTPGYFGSLRWIMRSSDIPDILKYLTQNSISAAWHIHSPAQYWEAKREKLEKMHPTYTEAKIEKLFETIKDEIFASISEVLSGKKNTGKFIETVDFYDDQGNACAWKVEPIDFKNKDFIESQIKVSDKADSATTSGIGLHPSLSNIMVQGKLASGSEMLYALKLYLASDTNIPESVIFQGINNAIAANFPNKDVQLGFYHQIVLREEDVKPDERTKNNI